MISHILKITEDFFIAIVMLTSITLLLPDDFITFNKKFKNCYLFGAKCYQLGRGFALKIKQDCGSYDEQVQPQEYPFKAAWCLCI